jgi:hypothetical protein
MIQRIVITASFLVYREAEVRAAQASIVEPKAKDSFQHTGNAQRGKKMRQQEKSTS